GYEICRFRPYSSGHGGAIYALRAERARPASRNQRRLAMTQFTVHTVESAPAASRPLIEGIHRGFGFVPNLFAIFAQSPAALRGALPIYDAFSTSSLAPAEQHLVMLAVSEANDCEYCVAAHSTLAKRLAKVDAALVSATRRREPLGNPKLDTLVTFTRKVV